MTVQTTPVPQPETIQRLSGSVYLAFALLAGIQLDVFTPLKDGPLTAEQLAQTLGVGSLRLRQLLYVLVVAGMLTVEDERFANTSEASYYLVRGSAGYMGGVHGLWSNIWPPGLKTAESIRTGLPQAKVDWSTVSPEGLETWLRGLLVGATASGRTLANQYDFSTYRTVVDVGGGSGGLAIALTEEHPHIRATVADLPNVIAIAQRIIAETAATDRVQTLAVDLMREALSGSFDAAVLRDFIQVLSPHEARQAIMTVGSALNLGGTIYILGYILDDSRLAPLHAVSRNIFFLNAFDGGQAYTEGEYKEWLTAASFENIERVVQSDGKSIISARKRA
jgi:hypothetical protein